MLRIISLAAVLACVAAAGLHADVIETDSTRYIIVMNQGGAVIDGPYQADSTSVTGLFDEYLESHAWDEFHGGSSQSTQVSDIDAGIYSANLSVRTDAGGGTMGTEIATGYAESSFELLFTLTEETDFTVTGYYNAFGFINGAISESEVKIDSLGAGSPSQVIAYTVDGCCPQIDVSGTLLPGDYALRAHALAVVDHSFMTSYTDSNADANFTFTLDVPHGPAPGDMDCSGVVDADDVAPFIQALLDPDGYDAAHPDCDKDLADINADAARDGDDIALFTQCLLAGGCP